MVVFPNCKINLGLNVVAKRTDGFHDLETVFFPLSLCDVLEIVPASDNQLSFQSTGLPIPGDPSGNLCMKAFHLLDAVFHLPPVAIHLHKIIPMGAGLGGGSSDGTYMLKLLNEVFSLGLSNEILISYARQLGSDCAFFVSSTPVFASGKGDIFEPVNLSLAGYQLVLVVPPFHVNTAQAYAGIKPQRPGRSLRELSSVPVEEWKEHFFNDFEAVVFQKFPEIGEIKQRLFTAGAVYASMTGSGSAVYGLFRIDRTPDFTFPDSLVWRSELT